MSLPLKIGIGLATFGTVGGVGYGIVAYSRDQGTEISKLIEEEYKYILLDTKDGNKDDAQWGTNWENYKRANQNNDKDFFELTSWTKGTDANLKDELRKKCEVLSKSKIKNTKEEIYKHVTNYCGRYVTVLDEAEKKGLAILVTDKVADGEDTIWAPKVSIPKTDLAKLKIEESQPNAENIRAGCGKIRGKSKKDSDYSEVYEIYEKVCTKPKTAELG